MKILENAFVQPESTVLTDNEKVKIEQFKIADDLSTTTITLMPEQEYTFTSRSGILATQIGGGTISNGSTSYDLGMFNKVAIERGENITLINNQTYPLVVNMITAN